MLELGKYRFDLTHRGLVMGILNRTTDSFFDQGAHFEFEKFLVRSNELVVDGADILDVGGVKAGVGKEIGTQEEIERVVPAVAALAERFDVAISVDTWNFEVLRESIGVGAVLGNDISGFADRRYLDVAGASGAGVVATHIRLAPRIPDPNPVYGDLLGEVRNYLAQRISWALDAGVSADSIIIDAGLDLGKTTDQSLDLLRHSDMFAAMGYPLLLSASNKDFLGSHLGLELYDRGPASISAALVAYLGGARIFRVHNVKGTRRALEVCAEISIRRKRP